MYVSRAPRPIAPHATANGDLWHSRQRPTVESEDLSIHQEVRVSYRYIVHFTHGLFAPDNPILRATVGKDNLDSPQKLLAVVDANIATCHPHLVNAIESYCHQHAGAINLVCRPLIVPGGEDVKNDHSYVEVIHRAIHTFGLDRHSYVIAVGSGAVLDLVGYAASTAHRGVRLLRVPTSVLSQADSGVGVKNGVNAFGKKNFIGTFAPPFAVFNDFELLATLPDREWRSGIAEAIKVALLKDAAFFEYLELAVHRLLARDPRAMQRLIYRCAELHLKHIATCGDPFEQGSSRPLDFGHWAAHKLESLSNYRVRHGEAVAIGLALDSTYSYLAGLLGRRDWQRILSLIASLRLAVYAPELSRDLHNRTSPLCILNGLQEFREHLGGHLTITLLTHIGRGIEVHQIDEALMLRSIALLEQYENIQRYEAHHGHSTRYLPPLATAANRRLLHGASDTDSRSRGLPRSPRSSSRAAH